VARSARWQRFPWDHRLETSAALGLGLSYATEVPEVEVEIEGASHQWLVCWVAEITAGPVNAPWVLALRLHHRSLAWGSATGTECPSPAGNVTCYRGWAGWPA